MAPLQVSIRTLAVPVIVPHLVTNATGELVRSITVAPGEICTGMRQVVLPIAIASCVTDARTALCVIERVNEL